MTDNEIIKALEHDAISEFDHWVIDLINRQKAEIERLGEIINLQEERNNAQSRTIKAQTRVVKALECQINIAKAEAVKEFAEIVKANKNSLFNYIFSNKGFDKQINNLAKEWWLKSNGFTKKNH